MVYISLDLEWNQAYAEQLQAVQKRLGARLRGEVIQIGAVKLDENGKIIGSYSVIVRPQYFRRIHRHVRDLTGITQKMMDGGLPLPEAAERFRTWCGEDFAFLTWGPDDIPMLADNMRVHSLDTSWLERTYDLQPIFNAQTDGETKQRSLEYAMEYFKIDSALPAHNALNDAYFTALVAAKLDLKTGISAATKRYSQYLEETEIGNADTGEIGFPDIRDVLADPGVTKPRCPLCSVPLNAEEKTLHAKGQRYITLMSCPEHGKLFVKYKLQRNFNDTWRARKTVWEPGDGEIDDYLAKLAEQENAAKERTRRRRQRRRRAKPVGEENTQHPSAVTAEKE